MTAYVFPASPQIGDEYERWIWDGEKWSLSGYTTTFTELFNTSHPDQLMLLRVRE